MGGQAESTIGPKKSAMPSGIIGPVKLTPKPDIDIDEPSLFQSVARTEQNIRFHETDGMIHFHVDDEMLKVAMTAAQWWSCWEEVSNMRNTRYRFVDAVNATVIEIRAGLLGGFLDLQIVIAGCPEMGPTLNALAEFNAAIGN